MADDTTRNRNLSNDDRVTDSTRRTNDPDANPDPITGAPGSHPIGTGVGAAAGGVAAGVAGAKIGAAAGTVAAPGVGTVVGAAIGAVAGGLIGKGVAEGVNPSEEHEYWRSNYSTRPYADRNYSYDEDYAPAYQYGWESSAKHSGRRFEEVENDLGRDWDRFKGKSRLTWDRAKNASRDAWDRVTHKTTHAANRSMESDAASMRSNDPDRRV
jgi:hypothetical protein